MVSDDEDDRIDLPTLSRCVVMATLHFLVADGHAVYRDGKDAQVLIVDGARYRVSVEAVK